MFVVIVVMTAVELVGDIAIKKNKIIQKKSNQIKFFFLNHPTEKLKSTYDEQQDMQWLSGAGANVAMIVTGVVQVLMVLIMHCDDVILMQRL